MNDFSIRISVSDGNTVRSIDIDTFPSAAPTLQLAKAPEPSRFIDNQDGTVTDLRTGLMWTRDDVSTDRLTFSKAEEACKGARIGGHADWALPTREQLLTLVDDTRHDPAIDISAFPNCKSEWYWTRTPYAPNASGYAWCVRFRLRHFLPRPPRQPLPRARGARRVQSVIGLSERT